LHYRALKFTLEVQQQMVAGLHKIPMDLFE